MNRLFLPIEIKVREFHSKMLFSLFAAEQGFETVLGGQIELIEKMPALGRGLYIDKSTAITKREWFHRLHALGNHVAAWDEEGLVYLSDEVYHATRMDPEAFRLTDLFFSWGPHHTRTVLAGYPGAADRVVAGGNPRMDLLRPEFRGYCDARVAELRKRHGRILLVNTNFALHHFAKGKEAAARIFDPYPLGGKAALLKGWYAFQEEGCNAFMEAAAALHDRFPDHTIVIRPCPAEDSAPWRRLMEGKPRGIVSKEGNVVEWMRAAEATLQFNCTTGVEAYLLGWPSIAYRPVRSDEFETPLPIACGLEAFTLEEVLSRTEQLVSAHASGRSPPEPDEDRLRIITDHLGPPGGPTSCERILAEIRRRDFPERAIALPPLPLIKRAWRAWLRVVRRPDPADIRFYREKFPGLDLAEARAVAEAFSRANGRFAGVRVTRAGPNLVRITPP
jgi:surface carbohydrate biosynthesis protein